jgi:hypothetical protein
MPDMLRRGFFPHAATKTARATKISPLQQTNRIQTRIAATAIYQIIGHPTYQFAECSESSDLVKIEALLSPH